MIWLKFNFFANSVISIIKETVPENLNCMLSCRCKPSCKTFDIIVQIIKLGYYFKSNHLKLHVHAPFKPAVSSSRYPPVIWSTTVDRSSNNLLKIRFQSNVCHIEEWQIDRRDESIFALRYRCRIIFCSARNKAT